MDDYIDAEIVGNLPTIIDTTVPVEQADSYCFQHCLNYKHLCIGCNKVLPYGNYKCTHFIYKNRKTSLGGDLMRDAKNNLCIMCLNFVEHCCPIESMAFIYDLCKIQNLKFYKRKNYNEVNKLVETNSIAFPKNDNIIDIELPKRIIFPPFVYFKGVNTDSTLGYEIGVDYADENTESFTVYVSRLRYKTQELELWLNSMKKDYEISSWENYYDRTTSYGFRKRKINE
jgi:hypothetical protein